MSTSADAKFHTCRKQKRAEKSKKEAEISNTLFDIEDRLLNIIDAKANKLGIEASDLHKQVLYQSTARQHAKATAWNSYLHEKSKEWEHLKGSAVEKYPGVQFVNKVAKQISDSGEYAKLSEKEKTYYEEVARKLRDKRLNAGAARNNDSRLMQGPIKKELGDIGDRLDHIHQVTGTEFIFLAIRGSPTDGLKPVYYLLKKARMFLKSYLKQTVAVLVGYMERSVETGCYDPDNSQNGTRTFNKDS
ncbi:hypothetical protein FRC12_019345 [Ceratobasidium sp. 428]|nr:hypothetical protein FRC12_019345 [Ceratobasidium sp. 428]